MPYSSYNAYIVQTNLSLILGIAAVNHIATVLKITPLLFILNWFYFQIAEYLLVCACLYNIYLATRDVINPYISNIHVPFHSYIFTPGPLVTSIYNVYCFLFRGLRTTTTEQPPKTEEQKPSEQNIQRNMFASFLSSQNSFNVNNSATQSTNIPTDNTAPTSSTTTTVPSTDNVFKPQVISPIASSAINLTNYSLTNTLPQASQFGNIIPKLKYTPCIRPPLQPSAHRERILWYLSPTPEVVEDFRIEQIIGFQKNWHRFNDRFSRTYYDNLTAALLKYIFTPLATSIETINKKLPMNQTIATCTPSAVALSFILPDFNNDTTFTMSEVLQFLTLETHASSEAIQYVSERVKELAANKKMAAYTYTPKRSGMPTDSAIIMHIFKHYLITKEPYAIPPLVPEEIDLFKFLLIYVYMTPELDHWKVFERD